MKKFASITIIITLSATILAFSGCASANKSQDNEAIPQSQEELSAKPDTDVDLYSEALGLNQKISKPIQQREIKKASTTTKDKTKVTKKTHKHKKTKKTPAKT